MSTRYVRYRGCGGSVPGGEPGGVVESERQGPDGKGPAARPCRIVPGHMGVLSDRPACQRLVQFRNLVLHGYERIADFETFRDEVFRYEEGRGSRRIRSPRRFRASP